MDRVFIFIIFSSLSRRSGESNENKNKISCLSKRSVDPAVGAPQRPVKFMAMRSEAHLTGVAPADGGACPVAPADGTGARDIINNSR